MSFENLVHATSWAPATKRTFRLLTYAALSCTFLPAAAQKTIRVPTDFATIQQAIGSSQAGDIVLVAPGVYAEQISFLGKSITVAGNGDGVILDGTSLIGPLVTFANGESQAATLANITVRNGRPSTVPSAGGIFILDASPTIRNTRIISNRGCGVGAVRSALILQGNTISGTILTPYAEACGASGITPYPSDDFGGGILLVGVSKDGLSAQITGNTVQGNSGSFGGAGITFVDAGFPMLANNVIQDNLGHDFGAGITILGSSSPTIVQNLIIRNTVDPTLFRAAGADVGAGIHVGGASSPMPPPFITNNTIAFNRILPEPNTNQQGSQIWMGTPLNAILTNNLIVGAASSSLIDCEENVVPTTPTGSFSHNDLFAQSGVLVTGSCSDPTGSDGNISIDPLFQDALAADAPDFRLRIGSSAVDSGLNNAPDLLPTDLLGSARIQQATQVSPPTIDMGVYEAAGIPGALPPPSPVSPPPVFPTFSLTTSSSLVTVRTEHHSSVQVNVQPLSGTLKTVTLACGVPLPVYVTCTFTPATLDISDGKTLRSSTLTIDTDAVLRFASTSPTSRSQVIWVALLLPLGFAFRRGRKLFGGSLLFLCFAMVGCSGRYPPSATPGTYSIVVTGSDDVSKTVQQTIIALVVTP